MKVNQIGFKKKSPTTDHLFVIKTLLDKLKSKKCKQIYACFVDFKKAFDTIWHNGLLYKILQLGISGKFYYMIKNIYENSLASVNSE